MRGGDEHRARIGRGERLHVEAQLVDRHGDRPHARLLGDQAVHVPARVLHRDRLHALPVQPAAEDREALHEARADEHVLRVGGRAAHASQVVGERFAQRRHAARVAVADRVERRLPERAAQRAQPAVAGKAGEVGKPGVEVVGKARQQRARGRPRDGRARGPGDAHGGALARLQVALGAQLTVGLGDDAARDAQLRRKPARGWQPRAGGQATAADVLAKRALQLLVQRQLAGAVEFDQQFRAGNWPIYIEHYWHCITDQCRRMVLVTRNHQEDRHEPAEPECKERERSHHDRRRRARRTDRGDHLRGGRRERVAARGARQPGRPRAQQRRPVQGQLRPARALQGRPVLALDGRAQAAAPLRRPAAGGRQVPLAGRGPAHAAARRDPVGAEVARARSPGRAGLPRVGLEPHRRAHRGDALGGGRRVQLPSRSRRAVGGVRVAANDPLAAQPAGRRALSDRRLECRRGLAGGSRARSWASRSRRAAAPASYRSRR